MGDLKSRRLIVAKGILFLAIVAASAGLIVLDRPSLRTAALVGVLIWAAARFYYFLFYVLERYVDPRLRYAGVLELMKAIARRRATATGTKRVIVAFPKMADTSAWQAVLALRERFDPLATKVPPHLTLVSPFEDSLSDEALARHMRDAVTKLRAFDVVLREVTAHEGEYLFLNVKRGTDALIELREALHTGTLAVHRARTHTFVPHLTIGRVSETDLPAALEATSGLTAPMAGKIDSIAVYKIEPDGKRPILFEVPLTGE